VSETEDIANVSYMGGDDWMPASPINALPAKVFTLNFRDFNLLINLICFFVSKAEEKNCATKIKRSNDFCF
jgi:hypothetical protein